MCLMIRVVSVRVIVVEKKHAIDACGVFSTKPDDEEECCNSVSCGEFPHMQR